MSFWRGVLIRATAIVLAVAVLFSALTLARPIAILIASVIIAVALEPLVKRIQRWMPRSVAAIVVYATIFLVFAGLFTFIGVRIADQVEQVIEEAPTNRDELVDIVNEYDPIGNGRLVEFLENQQPSTDGLAVEISMQITSTLAEIGIAIFLSIYLVISAPTLRQFFLSVFPTDGKRRQASDVLDSMGTLVGGYARAIAIDGIVIAIAAYIGLSLLGVRFALVLAILAGLSELVPIVGPIAAAIPAILIALTDSPLKALAVLVFYIVLQQVESNILLPKVMQSQANINPLLGLFAIFAGGSIGGILGALIAAPTAGAIQVLVTDALAPAIRNHNASGETDPANAAETREEDQPEG
ncbi:N/A [soil metagenome]